MQKLEALWKVCVNVAAVFVLTITPYYVWSMLKQAHRVMLMCLAYLVTVVFAYFSLVVEDANTYVIAILGTCGPVLYYTTAILLYRQLLSLGQASQHHGRLHIDQTLCRGWLIGSIVSAGIMTLVSQHLYRSIWVVSLVISTSFL